MRQTPDINPNIRKAQQDVDRFEASKKSLVPEFELPKDEEREKRYSEETLIADFITERIESKEAKEFINDPILIKTAYQRFLSHAKQGKEGNTTHAAFALWTSSALLATNTLHLLAPEEEKELQRYLNDPILIKTAYQDFLSYAKKGKEGNIVDAALALWTSSALLATNTLRLLAPEEEKELQRYLNDPIFIKTAYQDFLSDARQGKEGDTTSAAWALLTSSALLATNTLHLLAPEEEKELQAYLNDPILIKNAYQDFLSHAKEGKEGNTGNAAWALRTSSALTTVRNYLREKGKKIDDTNAANEALKFKKTIPPRPETRAF